MKEWNMTEDMAENRSVCGTCKYRLAHYYMEEACRWEQQSFSCGIMFRSTATSTKRDRSVLAEGATWASGGLRQRTYSESKCIRHRCDTPALVVVVVRLEHYHRFIDSFDNHSIASGPALARWLEKRQCQRRNHTGTGDNLIAMNTLHACWDWDR